MNQSYFPCKSLRDKNTEISRCTLCEATRLLYRPHPEIPNMYYHVNKPSKRLTQTQYNKIMDRSCSIPETVSHLVNH